MKVLFITHPFRIEPLGIMYLSAVAKKAGHEVSLITTDEGLYGKLVSFKPDIVAYSIMTGNQQHFDMINRQLLDARPGLISIAGGPHPTFFPESRFNHSSFDAFCVGEGEDAFIDFLEDPHGDHRNVMPRFDDNRKKPRPLIADLDLLPFPDRDIVFQYDAIKNGPIKHFIASRGCPYNCSYCFNKAYGDIYPGQPRVRFRSIENVIAEIQDVRKKAPMEFVYFQDDTFILNKKWLQHFAEEYRKRVALPFHCHTRANLVDLDVVCALKHAGCYSVHLAAEAGNEKVREKILNRKMSNEQILYAVKLLQDNGIRVMLQNILGIPGTTLENDIETLELNIECNPTYSWASIFQPYPKTKLGEYAVRIGEYKGDFSDIGNNFFDSSPLDIPHKNEVENLQKLFAFAVKNPEIYRSGLLDTLIRMPALEVREKYAKIYTELRNKSDELLFGMKL